MHKRKVSMPPEWLDLITVRPVVQLVVTKKKRKRSKRRAASEKLKGGSGAGGSGAPLGRSLIRH